MSSTTAGSTSQTAGSTLGSSQVEPASTTSASTGSRGDAWTETVHRDHAINAARCEVMFAKTREELAALDAMDAAQLEAAAEVDTDKMEALRLSLETAEH